MYGQLGHGTKTNEILPRQIMELMGSTVTQVSHNSRRRLFIVVTVFITHTFQISCGRRHTLALVPSRGRVYAWGLGGAGQLGNRIAQNSTTPQVVLGPWLSPSGSSMINVDLQYSLYTTDCVVKHIFSGGDHCFATVTLRKVCFFIFVHTYTL